MKINKILLIVLSYFIFFINSSYAITFDEWKKDFKSRAIS